MENSVNQSAVRFVDYESKYRDAFRSLNEQWISQYFKMEEWDYKALDNPKEYILQKGGAIIVALYEDKPVGVCALIKINDPVYDFELAKMAVSPTMRGKHIGQMLGEATIEKAKELGCKMLYLESNTSLKPAISLYEKLGFKRVYGRVSPYERSDIQMEMEL